MARTTKKPPVASCTWQVTTPGELPVYVIGNSKELGEWNTNKAVLMQSGGRGQEAHHWNINLTFPLGQEVEFKFIQKSAEGDVMWEEGENRLFTADETGATIEWGNFR